MLPANSTTDKPSNPFQRSRHLRRTATLRRMVRETTLSVDDLIYPMFVNHSRPKKYYAT
ncbi:MAG: hypothetical protein V7K69_10440 [Nostoc sp.]|uniref:hypothetical protein n=1 Tax=Nostoc sp. TaxID=1180 RepID=UPI002FF8A908